MKLKGVILRFIEVDSERFLYFLKLWQRHTNCFCARLKCRSSLQLVFILTLQIMPAQQCVMIGCNFRMRDRPLLYFYTGTTYFSISSIKQLLNHFILRTYSGMQSLERVLQGFKFIFTHHIRRKCIECRLHIVKLESATQFLRCYKKK